MNELKPCPNCRETEQPCACIRNKCIKCGEPVGNVTFTYCDKCWDKDTTRQPTTEQALRERVGELEQANRWISVKDRLPERGKAVITARQRIVRVEMLMLPSNRWSVDISGAVGCFSPVTHWMPLPTPPAKETEAANDNQN